MGGVVSKAASVIGCVAQAGKHVVGFVGDILNLREKHREEVSFGDLTKLLGNGFQHVLKQSDRNYEAVLQNLKAIQENYQIIANIKSQVDTTLTTIVHRFDDLNEQFSQTRKALKEGFERIETLITENEIKGVMSGLTTFIEDFTTKIDGLMELSHEERTATLKSSLNYFETATTPQSPLSLHSLLNRILDGGFAVPKTADDEVAFAALFLLNLGTDTYIDIFQFLIQGYEYLAVDHYSRSEVEEYNNYYSTSVTTMKDFRNRLYGVGGQIGIIGKVVREFLKVRDLDFIKNEKQEVNTILSKKIDVLEKTRKIFADINHSRQQPNSRILFDFNDCAVETPFIKWQDNRTVQYAIQYVHDKTYSPVSNWTPFTIYGKGCPTLDVGDAPKGTTRIIFRRFDQEKPQLVSIIDDPTQTAVRDIDRDLYDAVSEANTDLAKINAAALINHGANITASFEQGQQAIHACARSGHLSIITDLVEKGASVNARDDRGYSPLHIAAERGNEKLVTALLDLNADVGLKSQQNFTALHMAAQHDHAKTMQVLLQADRVEANAKAAGGFRPLHMAVTSGQARAVEILRADERTNVNAQSDSLVTPVHLAVLNLNEEILQLLLRNDKCNVNVGAQGGLAALHLAVSAGDTNFVGRLLQHNATDVNAKSDDGWSPLHLAISLKNDDITKQLLDSTKTNVNIVGKDNLTPLHLASRTGQTGIISNLLDHGADLRLRDCQDYTPLHHAVEKDQFETVKHLVEKGAPVGRDILQMASLTNNSELVKYFIFNESTLLYGQTPLHNAAAFGNVDLVSYVFEKHNDVNAKDDFDRTPLHYAVVSGKNDVVDYLIDKGADVNLADSDDHTPLHFAVLTDNLNVEMYLKNARNATINAQNFKKQTALHLAISLGKLEVAKHLVENGAEVNSRDTNLQTPLLYAVRSRNIASVQYLVEKKANVDARDSSGSPVLIEAIRLNQLDFVKYLTEKGANVTQECTGERFTPLAEASRRGHIEIMKYLEGKGAKVNAKAYLGQTVLHYAVNAGKIDAVKYLVETKTCDINGTTADGKTLLHYAAKSRNLDIVKYLVEETGLDIMSKDETESTPLHIAASTSGNLDIVKYLIEKKSDINAANKIGMVPLHFSPRSGDVDTVKYLIDDCKCDITRKDNSERTVFHHAAGCQNVDTVKYLLTKPFRADSREKLNKTALFYAASVGSLNIVKFLLEIGLDVNTRDSDRGIPLHYAAFNGRLDVVKYLVEEGSDVRAKDKAGNTPLHRAASAGHTDIAAFLAEKCGCVFMKNGEGKSPLNLASTAALPDIVQILKNKNGDVSPRLPGDFYPSSKITRSARLEIANHPHSTKTIVGEIAQSLSASAFMGVLGEVGDRRHDEDFKHEVVESGRNVQFKAKQKLPDNARSKRSRRSVDPSNKETPLNQNALARQVPTVSVASYADSGMQTSSLRVIGNPAPQTKTYVDWQTRLGIGSSQKFSSAGTTSSEGPLSHSSLLNENAFLVKWLLHLFGKRSFVEGMNKAERLSGGESVTETDWAETYLRQGMARYR